MWGQHSDRRGPCANGRGERLRLAGKAGQRIGIENHGARAGERGAHLLAHVLADPAAWAEHRHIAPCVGEKFGELGGAVDRAHHHRKAGGSIDRECVTRGGNGHQAGPCPQCPACGQPRRAGRCHAT